jgi:uncharacterized protein (TIGR02996 family)
MHMTWENPHQPFLDEIRRNPEYPAPRLIYGDWLADRGAAHRVELLQKEVERWRYEIARTCHGLLEAEAAFGQAFDEAALARIADPPEPAEGFLTYLDPGLSMLQMGKAVEGRGPIFYPATSCWEGQEFAQRTDQPHYRQLRMHAVPESFDRSYADQLALLGEDEEAPRARTVIAGMVALFRMTGERLFPNYWVRTADVLADGHRVDVSFGDDGLYVSDYTGDNYRFDDLGLASLRKVPPVLGS